MLHCIIGFDVAEISEDSPDDFEGLDASAAHIANLLSTEPADGKCLNFPPQNIHKIYGGVLAFCLVKQSIFSNG